MGCDPHGKTHHKSKRKPKSQCRIYERHVRTPGHTDHFLLKNSLIVFLLDSYDVPDAHKQTK